MDKKRFAEVFFKAREMYRRQSVGVDIHPPVLELQFAKQRIFARLTKGNALPVKLLTE